jgi:VanZ family protein
MIRKYIFALIWLGLMTYASLTPPQQLPDFILFKHADKVIHLLMYLGLAFLLIPVFVKNNKYTKSYIMAISIALIIGITFEILQVTATQGRSGDIYDVVANFTGGLIGVLIYQLIIRGRKLEKILFKI